MYESRDQPLISGWQFTKRLLAHALIGIVFVAFSLMLGALGHMWFEENVHWHDAALNAAMMGGGWGRWPCLKHGLARCSLPFMVRISVWYWPRLSV